MPPLSGAAPRARVAPEIFARRRRCQDGFFTPHSLCGVPVRHVVTGKSAVTVLTFYRFRGAFIAGAKCAAIKSSITQIEWLIIAETSKKLWLSIYFWYFLLPVSFYSSPHPSSGPYMGAAILPSMCTDRPGTAFGIPCYHAEFPVVRG